MDGLRQSSTKKKNSPPNSKELEALNHLLQTIITHSSQAVLFIDTDGVVTVYNHSAEKILGISSKKVLSHPFWKNFSDALFGFSMKEVLASKTAPEITHPFLVQKEGKIEIEVEAIFIEPAGLLLSIRDMTEIRSLQMAIARADRMKELGEMVAMVAHEIRNPLGGIKGFASLLERDLKDQPELQTMAHHIVEGTDNLSHLVSTVLNYAKPLKPEIEWIELNELVKDLSEYILADPQLNQQLTINIESTAKKLIAPIDPTLIRSALLNLMVNAIQAMPNGGTLSLSLRTSNDLAFISIKDTGVGIPEDHISKLYTPFFTTKPDGNGFGLAEVLKILRVHGGEIEVSSKVGEGTCFTIKLPLKPKPLIVPRG